MSIHLPVLLLNLVLYTKSSTRSVIDEDIEAWRMRLALPVRGKMLSLLYLMTFVTSFRTLFFFRVQNVPMLVKILCPGYKGLIMTRGSHIGAGIFFFHPYSTIVNAKSIGRNCIIRQLTTIGNKGHEGDDDNKKPTLLDDVDVGAHAIIIGDVVVGNRVTIGAGAVVTKDVPDNCVVVGNPARIIRRDGIPTSITT